MKLEIFKEITHSYDTQEMFAMKSSLKNLTHGFPNLTAKNILENWPMILHNTRLIPLDSQTTFPLDFYHDFRSSCWNLQTLQPQPITGGKGGGVFEYHSHSITPQNVFSITHDVFSSWKYF